MPNINDPSEYARIRARYTELPPGYGWIEDPETLEITIVKQDDHLDARDHAEIALIRNISTINHAR